MACNGLVFIQVKVVVTLTGDCISHADINLKLPRSGKDLYQNTSIREDAPWRLQQVQDAGALFDAKHFYRV